MYKMSKKSKLRQNTGEKSDRGKGPGEEQRGRIVEVGTPLWQRSNRKRHVQFKAGKMYVIENMVHPDPRKGYVCIEQDYDQVMHFCWTERDAVGAKEDDLTPEPYDTIFKRVSKCTTGRVYVLKVKSTNQSHFFWMQEPSAEKDSELCSKVNYLLNFPPPWMRFPRVACNIKVPETSEGTQCDFADSDCISPTKSSKAIETLKQKIACVFETTVNTAPPEDGPEITAPDSARQALENSESVKKLEELLLKMAGTDVDTSNHLKSAQAEKTAFTTAAEDEDPAQGVREWSQRSLNVDEGRRSEADAENSDREYADAEEKRATSFTAQDCRLTKSWKDLASDILDQALRQKVDSEATKTALTEDPSDSAQNINEDQDEPDSQDGDVCVNIVLTDEQHSTSSESFENMSMSNNPAEENEPSLSNVVKRVVTKTKTIKSSCQLTSKTIHIELSDVSGNSGSGAEQNNSGSRTEPVETANLGLQETASLDVWESATEHTHFVDIRQHTTQTGICKLEPTQSSYKNIGLSYESSVESTPSEESRQDAFHTAPVRHRGAANIHSKWESATDPNSLESDSSYNVSVSPSQNNLIVKKLATAFETIPGTSKQTQTSFIESTMPTYTEEVSHTPISTKSEEEKDAIQASQGSNITSYRSNSTGSGETDKTMSEAESTPLPSSEDSQPNPQELSQVVPTVGEDGSSTVQNVSTELGRSSRSGASVQSNEAAKETSPESQLNVVSSSASDGKETLTVGSESSNLTEGNSETGTIFSDASNLPEQELKETMAGANVTGNPTKDVERPTTASPNTSISQSSKQASEMPHSKFGLDAIRSENADSNSEKEGLSPIEIGDEPPQITESAASEYSSETGKDTFLIQGSLHLNVTSSQSGSNKNELPVGTGERVNSTEKDQDMDTKTMLAAAGTSYADAPEGSVEPEKDTKPLNPQSVSSVPSEVNTKDLLATNSSQGNSAGKNREMNIKTGSATTSSNHSLSSDYSTHPENETSLHKDESSHSGSMTKEILAEPDGRDDSAKQSIKSTPSTALPKQSCASECSVEPEKKTSLLPGGSLMNGRSSPGGSTATTGGRRNAIEDNRDSLIKSLSAAAESSHSGASELSTKAGKESSQFPGDPLLNVTSSHGGPTANEIPEKTGRRGNSTEGNIKTSSISFHSGAPDSLKESDKNASPFNEGLQTLPSSHMESNRKEVLEGTGSTFSSTNDGKRRATPKTDTISLTRHSSTHSSQISYSIRSASDPSPRTIRSQIDITTQETEEFLIEVRAGPNRLKLEDIWHTQNPLFFESLQTDINSVLPSFDSTHKSSMKGTSNSATGSSGNDSNQGKTANQKHANENVEDVSGVIDLADDSLDDKSTNAIAMIALTQSGNENANGEAKLYVESGVNDTPQGISTSPLIINTESTRESSASVLSQNTSVSINEPLSTNVIKKKVRYNLRKRSQPRSETFLSGSAKSGAKRSRVSSPGVPMPTPFRVPDASPVRANRRYPQASGSTYLRTPGKNSRKRGTDNGSDSDQEVPQIKRGRISYEDSTWGEHSRPGSLSRPAKTQPGGSTRRTSGTPVTPSPRTSRYNSPSPSDPAKIEDGQQTEPVRIREIKKTGPETVVRTRTNRLSPVSPTPRISRENRDKAQNTRPVVVENRNDSKSKPRSPRLPEPYKKPKP